MDVEREIRDLLDDVGAADIPALEGPAPPDPPGPVEGHGDGEPHPHFIFQVKEPLVMVLADGSVRTNGSVGTALVVAFMLAAFVVVWQAIGHAAARLGPGPLIAVAVGAAVAVATVWALCSASAALRRRWRGRGEGA